ncbi:MAG: histidine kinase dimerization/phospho-acceptor domain-containing protein [Acidimicrobiales bacterium]
MSGVGAATGLTVAQLLDAIPDALLIHDFEGTIHGFNATVCELTDRDADALAGKVTALGLVPDDDHRRIAEAFVECRQAGRSRIVRHRILRGDGTILHVEGRAAVTTASEGEPLLVVSMRDASHLAALEEDLRAALARVEAASAAKHDVVSRFSHELRQPLNAILGFGDLLRHEDLPEPSAEAVELIVESGRRLLRTLEQVLDLARILSGVLDLDIRPVEVGRLVEAAIERAGVGSVPLIGNPATTVAVDEARVARALADLIAAAGGMAAVSVIVVGDLASVVVSGTPPDGFGVDLARGLARLHGGDAHSFVGTPDGCAFTLPLASESR